MACQQPSPRIPGSDRPTFIIRAVRPEEHAALGQLMVRVYAALEGFPKPDQAPAYYQMLTDIGLQARKPGAKLLAACAGDTLLGGVVYFSDMTQYGSGGTATRERQASGFRLLAVDPAAGRQGIGRALVEACIAQAREDGNLQVILHTTKAMPVAWRMYEQRGFRHAPDLDFIQGELPVFGFRLAL